MFLVQYCQIHGYTFAEGKQNYCSLSIKFIDDISEDISNFSFANTDESAVLNSHYFSAYRGTLVIRTNGDRSGTVGIMFLSRKTNSQPDAVDTVRHEYGHAVQLREMGLVNFLFAVGIPSALNLGSGNYYDKPWEITADILGNVQSRTHSTENAIRGAIYYAAGTISFVAAYLTLR